MQFRFQKTLIQAREHSCDDAESPHRELSQLAYRGTRATISTDLGSRHTPHDVVRQVSQHGLGVGILEAIECVGGLFGMASGALPGIFQRA